jgi:esterase/lipase superfamily enzyme
MNVEYHHWESPRLNQKFECKRYGNSGLPMLAFQSSEGHFWDYENNGMIEACRPWIDSGRLQVFSADGRDWETWSNTRIHPHDRASRHEAWESAIVNEVVPLIRQTAGVEGRDMIVTGCSGGAFHAANFMFKHPDLCNTAILISGVYSTKHFRTDHVDDYDYSDPLIYFNNPLRYLKDMHDDWYLSRLRKSRIIACCGQGMWEEECLEETKQLSVELKAKDVPHWLDLWGHDVNHDWPWWRAQIAYFLGKLEI